MKKILLLSFELPPQIGGAGVVGYNTAKALAQIGYDVTLVSEKSNVKSHNREELPFNLIGIKTIKFIRPLIIWFKLRKILDDYDLIILNDGVAKKFGAYCLGQRYHSKTVIYSHGQEGPWIFESRSIKYRLARYSQKLSNLMHNCRKVVSVSEYMKQELLSCKTLKDLSGNIEVVYNGYDSSIFKPVNTNKRQELNIPNDADVLISISRIVRDKGYLKKLDIFERLIRDGVIYYWIIVGGEIIINNDEFLKELKEQIRERGLSKYIRFTGSVKQTELSSYLCSANVFWLLSNYNESFGNVYIEANACGLPSIGVDRGGVKEAIEDGVSGFVLSDGPNCQTILKEKRWENIKQSDIENHVRKFSLLDNIKNADFLHDN